MQDKSNLIYGTYFSHNQSTEEFLYKYIHALIAFNELIEIRI